MCQTTTPARLTERLVGPSSRHHFIPPNQNLRAQVCPFFSGALLLQRVPGRSLTPVVFPPVGLPEPGVVSVTHDSSCRLDRGRWKDDRALLSFFVLCPPVPPPLSHTPTPVSPLSVPPSLSRVSCPRAVALQLQVKSDSLRLRLSVCPSIASLSLVCVST